MQVLTTNLKTWQVGTSLAFAPDGRRLAVLSASSGVAVLEPPAQAPIASILHRRIGYGVGLTADGRVVHVRKGVQLYDPDRRKVVGHLATRACGSCVAVSPDGWTIWADVRDDEGPALRRWDVATRKPTGTFGRPPGFVWRLAVSDTGAVVAACMADEVRVWRWQGDKAPTRAALIGKIKPNAARGVAVSPDGTLVAGHPYWPASSHSTARCPVHVWDTRTGKKRFRLESPSPTVGGVAFHPHRPVLAAVGKHGSAVYWDTTTGTELARFSWLDQDLYAVAFAPDGMRCAAAADGTVVVWDVD
jgi:WD40 repeat protein